MNPNEFGKKLGIGLRVAGRIAQQRAQENARNAAQKPIQPSQPAPQTASSSASQYSSAPPRQAPGPSSQPQFISPAQAARAREIGKDAHKLTRAAGRGVGGFLRPFGRVGGILWLEITGFFFALFAIWFAQDIWRTRLSYLHGPEHQRFLIAIGLTVVFGYLSVSAFWRAKRR